VRLLIARAPGRAGERGCDAPVGISDDYCSRALWFQRFVGLLAMIMRIFEI
jgi:hypothetical protein